MQIINQIKVFKAPCVVNRTLPCLARNYAHYSPFKLKHEKTLTHASQIINTPILGFLTPFLGCLNILIELQLLNLINCIRFLREHNCSVNPLKTVNIAELSLFGF